MRHILLTFSCFMTSRDFLSNLVARFLSFASKPAFSEISLIVPERVCVILKQWLTISPGTFQRDCKLTQIVLQLLEHPSLPVTEARKVRQIVESSILYKRRSIQFPKMEIGKLPRPILPTLFTPQYFEFIDLDPLEVSKQLTLLDHSLYCRLEKKELLKCRWSKPNKQLHSPNVTLLSHRFNNLSRWVISMIVGMADLQPRVLMLMRFIVIAYYCLRLRNFNTTAAILSALNASPVRRLQKTWQGVHEFYVDLFDRMQGLLEPAKNFKIYRNVLNGSSTVPCMPYLGRFLTDLTFISEMKDGSNGMVNVQKCLKLAKVISQIFKYREVKFLFTPVPSIQAYFCSLEVPSEEELFKASLKVEPKEFDFDYF